MKKLIIALVMIGAITANASLLLQETFSHPSGAPLIGTTPELGSTWATNGTGTGIKSNVVEGSLSTPSGFPASTGNSVKTSMSSEWTGKEMHSRFTAQTGAGAVTYMSFLVNVDAMTAAKGGAVIALSDNSAAEYASLMITNTTGNSYATLGLGGRSGAPGVWSPNQYQTNTTHLVVVSYEIVSGSGNDVMKMWIDPTSFGGAAPLYDMTLTGFTDVGIAGLNTIELKNGSSAPRVIIDELRVGTTWADVTPTIPEPATVGMLGLGALVTLLIRRVRNR